MSCHTIDRITEKWRADQVGTARGRAEWFAASDAQVLWRRVRGLTALTFGGVAILVGCGGGGGSGSSDGTISAAGVASTSLASYCPSGLDAADALAKINAIRAVARSCGSVAYAAAPPLQWSTALASAAQSHSSDMANQNFFSHTGSNGSSTLDRTKAAGYISSWVAENIYGGQKTYDAALQGWLQSQDHCANIMSATYKYYGVACASSASSQFGVYWTQDFGG